MAANAANTPRGRITDFHTRTRTGTRGLTGRSYHSGWPGTRTVMTLVPPTPSGSYNIASLKPAVFNWLTRVFAMATMSSLVPKLRQPVGQALIHAGSSPTSTRSTQRVHLAILPVLTWNFGTSNGQP